MLISSECSCLFLGMTISIWIYKIQLEYRQKVLFSLIPGRAETTQAGFSRWPIRYSSDCDTDQINSSGQGQDWPLTSTSLWKFISFKKNDVKHHHDKAGTSGSPRTPSGCKLPKNCCFVTWTLRFISVVWLFLDKQICLKNKKELAGRKSIFYGQPAGSSAVKTELSSDFIWLSVFLKNFTAGIKVEEQTVILIFKLLILWLFCSRKVD